MEIREYTIQDKVGVHARSVSLIARLALPDKEAIIKISCRGNTVSATHLTGMVAMQVQQGDTIVISVEGGRNSSLPIRLIFF